MLTAVLVFLLGSASFFILHATSGQKFPPPLSYKEECELFQKMHEHQDEDARAQLIEHNLRLVSHITRKFYSQQISQDDLISLGTIGLIKAVDSFNEKNGARFATYAAKCIQNEILMYFRTQKKNMYEISMNETIDTDRDGNPITYTDIIREEDTIADDLHERCQIDQMISYIKTQLSDRERKIIMQRYGLGNIPVATQKEVADALGISRSYVSRIEKNVLQQLQKHLHSEL